MSVTQSDYRRSQVDGISHKKPKKMLITKRVKKHKHFFNNKKNKKNIRTIRYSAKEFHYQISDSTVKYPAG